MVSVAAIIAVGVNSDGRRAVLGPDIGTSEAEPFRTGFWCKLTRRRPRGVKLGISDAHAGIKAADSRVLSSAWQRCRAHFMRNAPAHAGKSDSRGVSASIATAFAQDRSYAATRRRGIADQLRSKLPELAMLLNGAEHDVLACMGFPAAHRTKLHATNPIERLNGEIRRRTEVVGIFPDEQAITRLVGAILMEHSEEWAVQRARCITPETMTPVGDDPSLMLSAVPGA